MRRLVFAVLVLAALYAGYWFVGSSRVEAGAIRAIEAARAAGWQVAYTDLTTVGFPSRFDTTVTDLAVLSSDGQTAYEADFVQVLALSYQPNKVIAVFPPTQSVLLGGQVVTVEADGLRASATITLGPDLVLDHAAAESGPATVRSRDGLGFGIDAMNAGLRRSADGGPNAYDLYLGADGLRPLAPDAGQGELRLAATFALDRPLDRHFAEAPRLVSLRLDEARLSQGDVAVAASGELSADAKGYLAGTLRLRVEDWRGLLALLETAGMPAGDTPLLVAALEGMAQGGDAIEVPVTLADGRIEALGLLLGEAPRVR